MKTAYPFEIEKKPCDTLKDCLTSYTKKQLCMLAEKMSLDKSTKINSLKKDSLVALLESKILDSVPSIFRFLPPEIFIVIAAISKETVEEKDRCLKIIEDNFGEDFENISVAATGFAITSGFLFVFKESSEAFPEMIIPRELRKIITDLHKDAKAEKYFPGDMTDFLNYAETLASLYGICTADVFMQIYNRDFPEKKIDERKEFVSLMQQSSMASGYLFFKDENLVSATVDREDWYDNIIIDRKNFKPYIPSKKELSEKLDYSEYDDDLPAFNDCISFFSKLLNDNDYATDIVLDFFPMAKLHYPINAVIEYISQNKDLEFDEKSLHEFLHILQNLYNSCHSWSNWGHPSESCRDDDGRYSKETFNEDFFTQQKDIRENRPHIELPDSCVVPSKEQAEKRREQFDEYWGNNDIKPAWYSNERLILTRLKYEMKKSRETLESFPEKLVSMLIDGWLASLWHVNANHGGDFGNQRWNYYALDIAEKIAENTYTCLQADGSPIVVYSPTVQTLFEDDVQSCFGVLVDMGGWFIVYGALLWWKGIRARDIESFARIVAPQMYELKGLSGVVQFNPVPLWCSYSVSRVPPIAHKGEPVVICMAETRFTANLPDEIKSKWTHETGGKYERWISSKDDYMDSASVFLDTKNGTVYLHSSSEKNFDRLLNILSDCTDKKHYKEERMSMIMQSVIEGRSKLFGKLEKLESVFNK